MLKPGFQDSREINEEKTVLSVIEVALERIHPNPFQQRTIVNPRHIERLAMSIESDGLQQPPQARECPHLPGHYELVFGHNRFSAYQRLNKQYPDNPCYARMPVIPVRLDERQMFEGGITENLQREDISPIAKAKALKTYIETFKASQRQCGALFGISQGAVSNLIRLLSLPDEIVDMTDQGILSERQTRFMVGLPDPVAIKIVRGAARLDEDARPAYLERCVREAKAVMKAADKSMQSPHVSALSGSSQTRSHNALLLDPEACPCCYRTPKSYVRQGRKWQCGTCHADVQLNVVLVSSSASIAVLEPS